MVDKFIAFDSLWVARAGFNANAQTYVPELNQWKARSEMNAVSSIRAQPPIVMTTVDANLLSKLLQDGADRHSEGVKFLAREMRRATRIDPKQAMGNLVTPNSYVVFRYAPPDEIRMVKLVYPGEATDKDIENLSVTTPIGAALIGLSEDQSFEWPDSDGDVHRVEVKLVLPPNSGPL